MKLRCSESNRWLHCSKSVQLRELLPPEESSPAAEEGTRAHAQLERCFQDPSYVPTMDGVQWAKDKLEDISADIDSTYTDALEDAVHFHIEEKLYLKGHEEIVNGTADYYAVYGDRCLHIADFKYGRIQVYAKDNTQMMNYAICATLKHDLPGDCKIIMTILQPNAGIKESHTTLTARELRSWYENTLLPVIEATAEGVFTQEVGPWCKYCRASKCCSALLSTVQQLMEEKLC